MSNPWVDDIAGCSDDDDDIYASLSQLNDADEQFINDDDDESFEDFTARQRASSREEDTMFGVAVEQGDNPPINDALDFFEKDLATIVNAFLEEHRANNDAALVGFLERLQAANTAIDFDLGSHCPVHNKIQRAFELMAAALMPYKPDDDPDNEDYADLETAFEKHMQKVVAVAQFHQVAVSAYEADTVTLLRHWPVYEEAEKCPKKARAWALQEVVVHMANSNLSYDQAKSEHYMYRKIMTDAGVWLNAYEPFRGKNARDEDIVYTLELYVLDMFADSTRFYRLAELDRLHGNNISMWVINRLANHQQAEIGLPAPTGETMLFSTERGLIDFVTETGVPHIWMRGDDDFGPVRLRVASRVIRTTGEGRECNVCPIDQLRAAIDYDASPPRWKRPEEWLRCNRDWVWYKIWRDQGVFAGTDMYMFELGLLGRLCLPLKYERADFVSKRTVLAGDRYDTGLICYGASGVGKSTAVKAALKVAFNQEDICTLRDKGGDDKFSTNEIVGKRIVFCDDMTKNTNISIDLLQALPEGGNGDYLTVEGKNEKPRGAIFNQPIVLNSNEEFPSNLNAEGRMMRRYIVLPFVQKNVQIGKEDKTIKSKMNRVCGNFFIETQIARYATYQYLREAKSDPSSGIKSEWDITGLRSRLDVQNRCRYTKVDAIYWAGNKDQKNIIHAIQAMLMDDDNDESKELELNPNGVLALAHLKWMVHDYLQRTDKTVGNNARWHEQRTWQDVVKLFPGLSILENESQIWPPTEHGVMYKDNKDSPFAQHTFVKGIRVRPVPRIYQRQPVNPIIGDEGARIGFWLDEEDDHQIILDSYGFGEQGPKTVFSVVICQDMRALAFVAKDQESEDVLMRELVEGAPVLDREAVLEIISDKVEFRDFAQSKRFPSLL
jgi:hypothetical protein